MKKSVSLVLIIAAPMIAILGLLIQVHQLETRINLLNKQQMDILNICETHTRTIDLQTKNMESISGMVAKQRKYSEELLSIISSHTRSIQMIADIEKSKLDSQQGILVGGK